MRRKLPPGETVPIALPAMESRELHFACWMGMFRGAIVISVVISVNDR
jgi:hypothetical protein